MPYRALDGYDCWDLPDLYVADEEPAPDRTSTILGPDGKPVVYRYKSPKLGYVGFISPEELNARRSRSPDSS